MFKPFQIPYQLPISDLPQVIAANNIRETNTFMHWCIYFFTILSQVVGQIFLWKDIGIFLLTIHFTSHLILRGFWNVNGYFSSGWSCIYPEGHCFDLDEGRQRKSGCSWPCPTLWRNVPEMSTSHNLLCGRQCAGAHECIIPSRRHRYLFCEFWNDFSNRQPDLMGCIVTLVALVELLSVMCV